MDSKLIHTTCFGLFVLCFFISPISQAQEVTVSGTVTNDETGEPLPGANVVVQGENRGTATGPNGQYEVEDVPSDGVLIFSFVGYNEKEIPVEGRSVIDVVLSPAEQQMEDLVVVGFGTKQDQDITGSISQVSAQDLENSQVTSFEEALQGRTPGANVTNSSGKVGEGVRVRIRGSSSLTGDNEPLYVIDGTPLDNQDLSVDGGPSNPLAQLNPNDIASIEVLKDASATAIYGARGSNGVVLISTKTGVEGGSQISFSLNRSWRGPTNKVEFLNASQYVDYYLESARNSSVVGEEFIRNWFDQVSRGLDWTQAIGEDATPVIDTDWQDQAFQNRSTGLEVSLSGRGGDENTTFYISGSYSQTDGLLIRNNLDRVSARVNVTHSFSDRFEMGTRFNLSRALNDRVAGDGSFSNPMQLVAQVPISPIYEPSTDVPTNSEGRLMEYKPTDEFNRSTVYLNSLIYKDNTRWQKTDNRVLGNAFSELSLLPGLTLRGEFGLDLRTSNTDRNWNSQVPGFENFDGESEQAWSQVLNYNVDTYLEYSNTFKDIHSLSGTTGFQLQNSTTNSASVTAQKFPSTSFREIDNAANVIGGGGSETGYRFLAYFARANYNYDEMYLLELSGRYEGSSRFGTESRYGFFPAVSAGWVLTEESFMPSSDVLSRLKLRASAGITGNGGIGNHDWRGLWGSSNYAGQSGIRPSQTANPSLQWEQTQEFTVGLDYSIFGRRVRGSIDYYHKDTKSLLLDVNVPSTTGFLDETRNIGSVENAGIELLIETQNLKGNLSWSSSFNISFNRNEVTDVEGQVLTGGFQNVNQAREGEPIGVFYTREYAGVDPENGDALYYVNEKDEDGNIVNPDATTADPTKANRVTVGSAQPDFTGGFSNTVEYNNFRLEALLQFSYGAEIYDGGGVFKYANGRFRDNQHISQLNAWEEPGDQTDVPEARLFENNGAVESSRYLFDASYLRLKNVTLSYSLPTQLAQQASVNNARIFLTVQNVLTLTPYEWWDPEASTDYAEDNQGIGIGNEFYTAPQAQSVTGGIRFSF